MKTQYGRTLVEILGALALIGALTFIGVKSYKILYAKHQANEAFESVQCQMLELDLLDLDRIDLDEDITSGACENDSGVEIKVVRTEMEDEDGGEISSGYYVELTDLTPEACRQVLSKPWETEFEIAVGCEGRTFNPDEPDYSVCDIFDEDYEPECLEEYIEEYIEEDIGEVSLLDNALPSDSIFHKILGISNAYARYDGTTVIYKKGKWIRIYRQVHTVVDASCPRELRTAARTCCPKRATPYFNGLFSGCCYRGSDGEYTLDQDDFAPADKKIIGEADTLTVHNVLFSIRSDIMVKKDIKEKKDDPSNLVELPLQDCCVSEAVRDIYDANGTWSGTKYCCESYETEGMSKECKEWFDRYGTSFRLFNPAPPKGCNNVDNLEYYGGKSSWDTDSDELYEKYKENADIYTKDHLSFPERITLFEPQPELELTNHFYAYFSKDVIRKKEPQPPALVYDKEMYKKLYAEYESKLKEYKEERSLYERFVKAFGDPHLRYLDDKKAAWALWKGIIPREDLIRRYEKWWDKALTDYGIPPENRTINIGGKLYPTTMSLIHDPDEDITFSYLQEELHSLSDNPTIITGEAESVFSATNGFSLSTSPSHLFIVSNSWSGIITSWRYCEELDYATKNSGLGWICGDNYKEALKFNAAALYLHEIGHGVDKLASKRKEATRIGLDNAMETLLTEIRSRLIEYQKLYQIVSANKKMSECVYDYDPAAIDKLFQNIDGSPYDPFKSERESMKQLLQKTKENCKDAHDKVQKFFGEIKAEGFMPFNEFYNTAQSKGIRRAMIEAGIKILDSDLLSSDNSYGGRAADTTPSGDYQATNIDWDSYIRQLPNDDVMSHAGMREILERSTTFWDWVCSTYSYLNPIQCMERQMANRAVKNGLCCPNGEDLYCAKWKKEDINKDGKNDKLHCEDGFAMCCPVGSVVAINKDGSGDLTAECCSTENVHLTGEIYKENERDDKEEGIPLSECCISDGMGNCCDLYTQEGCKCTKTYLYNHALYHVVKGNVTKDQFINGMVPCEGPFFDDPSLYKEINGEVYVAQYMERTCPNQDLVKVCDANCSYPYRREIETGDCPCGENQVWNSEQFACLCDAGYVWNDDKTKCVQCSYPECFDKKEKGCRQVSDYEKNEDGYCVSCTTTDCKGNCDAVSDGNNGCTTCANVDPGRPYWDGDSCEECPFANQIWDADNSVCVCADGYGLSEDGTVCRECTEYEYKNEYGYCVPCWEDKPVSDGNNYCTTCANVYWDRPYWDGDSCEPCPAEMPVWNGYSCQPCPEGTVYGQTSDGTMDCIEQETDTSNEERCMHYPETVWDGSRCVYCNEMPSCRPDGVGCTFESGRCV